MSNLDTQLASLRSRLNTLESITIPALENRISTLDSRVDQQQAEISQLRSLINSISCKC